ncbi:hypothetical protein [Zhihengliuella flava]|uniref:Uncharacterized protein n=1 Tax=Zhihengliuella flava TaxID=1285193 RepID=A0A931DAI0_9MICC|nr:hypothetical protein [Zhihengliuella flava]MBG6085462.1 hypothetical protein [Zhihengliuella flava]
MDDWIQITILGVMSVVLIASGILAYRNKYVAWLALKSFFPGWPGLAGLYLGIAFASLLVLSVLMDVATRGNPLLGLVVLVLFAVFVTSLLTGIVGMFWLPKFLLPKWIEEMADEIRRGDDPLSRDLRPGGKLHGRLGVPRAQQPPRSKEEHDERSE